MLEKRDLLGNLARRRCGNSLQGRWQAETVSEVLKLTAQDLHSLGIIDTVVPEPEGGAHLDPAASADTLKSHVLAALHAFADVPTNQLLDNRYKKYRHMDRAASSGGKKSGAA